MFNNVWSIGAFVCLVLSVSGTARAIVIYDEGVSGDLPAVSPPVFVLTQGPNKIIGSVGAAGDALDYLRVDVPSMSAIESIDYEYLFENDDTAFHAIILISDGEPFAPDPSQWDFTDTLDSGNLFDSPPASGPPVSEVTEGVHGFQLKANFDPTYSFTFNVVPVPEPSTLMMAMLGIALFFVVVVSGRSKSGNDTVRPSQKFTENPAWVATKNTSCPNLPTGPAA